MDEHTAGGSSESRCHRHHRNTDSSVISNTCDDVREIQGSSSSSSNHDTSEYTSSSGGESEDRVNEGKSQRKRTKFFSKKNSNHACQSASHSAVNDKEQEESESDQANNMLSAHDDSRSDFPATNNDGEEEDEEEDESRPINFDHTSDPQWCGEFSHGEGCQNDPNFLPGFDANNLINANLKANGFRPSTTSFRTKVLPNGYMRAGHTDPHSTDYVTSDDHNFEGYIQLVIRNFDAMTDTVRGPTRIINGIPWRIMVMPRSHVVQKKGAQKCLGFFLQCCPDSYADQWSVHSSAELRLISQKDGVPNFTRKTNHTYTSKENDWGYSCFMTWSDIIDPTQGFIKKNTVTLEVMVKADPAREIFTKMEFLKKIGDFLRVAEFQCSRCELDKALDMNLSALKLCKNRCERSKSLIAVQKERLIEMKVQETLSRIQTETKAAVSKDDVVTQQVLKQALTGNTTTLRKAVAVSKGKVAAASSGPSSEHNKNQKNLKNIAEAARNARNLTEAAKVMLETNKPPKMLTESQKKQIVEAEKRIGLRPFNYKEEGEKSATTTAKTTTAVSEDDSIRKFVAKIGKSENRQTSTSDKFLFTSKKVIETAFGLSDEAVAKLSKGEQKLLMTQFMIEQHEHIRKGLEQKKYEGNQPQFDATAISHPFMYSPRQYVMSSNEKNEVTFECWGVFEPPTQSEYIIPDPTAVAFLNNSILLDQDTTAMSNFVENIERNAKGFNVAREFMGMNNKSLDLKFSPGCIPMLNCPPPFDGKLPLPINPEYILNAQSINNYAAKQVDIFAQYFDEEARSKFGTTIDNILKIIEQLQQIQCPIPIETSPDDPVDFATKYAKIFSLQFSDYFNAQNGIKKEEVVVTPEQYLSSLTNDQKQMFSNCCYIMHLDLYRMHQLTSDMCTLITKFEVMSADEEVQKAYLTLVTVANEMVKFTIEAGNINKKNIIKTEAGDVLLKEDGGDLENSARPNMYSHNASFRAMCVSFQKSPLVQNKKVEINSVSDTINQLINVADRFKSRLCVVPSDFIKIVKRIDAKWSHFTKELLKREENYDIEFKQMQIKQDKTNNILTETREKLAASNKSNEQLKSQLAASQQEIKKLEKKIKGIILSEDDAKTERVKTAAAIKDNVEIKKKYEDEISKLKRENQSLADSKRNIQNELTSAQEGYQKAQHMLEERNNSLKTSQLTLVTYKRFSEKETASLHERFKRAETNYLEKCLENGVKELERAKENAKKELEVWKTHEENEKYRFSENIKKNITLLEEYIATIDSSVETHKSNYNKFYKEISAGKSISQLKKIKINRPPPLPKMEDLPILPRVHYSVLYNLTASTTSVTGNRDETNNVGFLVQQTLQNIQAESVTSHNPHHNNNNFQRDQSHHMRNSMNNNMRDNNFTNMNSMPTVRTNAYNYGSNIISSPVNNMQSNNAIAPIGRPIRNVNQTPKTSPPPLDNGIWGGTWGTTNVNSAVNDNMFGISTSGGTGNSNIFRDAFLGDSNFNRPDTNDNDYGNFSTSKYSSFNTPSLGPASKIVGAPSRAVNSQNSGYGVNGNSNHVSNYYNDSFNAISDSLDLKVSPSEMYKTQKWSTGVDTRSFNNTGNSSIAPIGTPASSSSNFVPAAYAPYQNISTPSTSSSNLYNQPLNNLNGSVEWNHFYGDVPKNIGRN
uniref:MATH domain-containing protein n=1 Tax=Rhabditophanes sp. KR3021 TaxID=114890 RepID=A0AC35U537_9BILA